MSENSYLTGLNQPQLEAVTTTKGPLLVLAGAGSGKTRVITHRIVYLIHQGVAPRNILAVTFTNKAAKEMRERVEKLVHEFPPSSRSVIDGMPTVTTFHALGVRILREHHDVLGLRRHFTIYDRSDSLRAIKQSLERANYNPKEFEPRKILSKISRAKGDAKTPTEFKEQASSYPDRVAAEVWIQYEEIMRAEQALDFDDLLIKTLRLIEEYPHVREVLQSRYRYIHIDEYQDTNRVQFEIARLLTDKEHNLCVVGDIDQCLTPNTKVTMGDGGEKYICDIKPGEQVLSNFGSGDYRPATVTKTHLVTPKRPLVTFTTEAGRTLTSTQNHIHFAGYRLDLSPQMYFVYLMKKVGTGWRLGTTSVYTQGQKKPMLGFVQRLNHEHGDALWILETYQTPKAARVAEYKLSLQYQIPTIPFVARKSKSIGGYAHDQQALDEIFSFFDTTTAAQKVLKHYNLLESYPHHRPQVSNSKRQNILVSLCGDHRGRTPMHRISLAGSDQETKRLLVKAGYSVRPARTKSKSWRVETAHSSYQTLRASVSDLSRLLPDALVVETARLGSQLRKSGVEKNSLPYLPAASIRPGMVLFAADGTYDVVQTVSLTLNKKGPVYDIDVTPTHNFIANGICTHNSIYSWRGADIKNVLQFERHFPNTKTILLEENYRSTKNIIGASNDVIIKNKNRVSKEVFTENEEGEKISLYAAMSGVDEAQYIAKTAKDLIGEGASPSSIAVLYRTNFQSRILEESFLDYGVPYQLLGTKFFERKEVKDVLSYLRLALNPGSTADLARVINEPARGIGKITMLKIMEGKRSELKGAILEKVTRFDQIMTDIADTARTKPITETVKFIIARTGMETELKKNGTEDDLSRLENLRELVTLAARYSELDPEEAVEALLENAALQSDQDELKDKEEQDAVRLMTVHSAKGLEFPYVFISGLEEGLFPHERLDDTGIDHEEERRLFYVALTRAGKKVFLSYAHMRTIYGSQRINVPSSFLNDISTKYIESKNPRGFGDTSSGYETTIFLD